MQRAFESNKKVTDLLFCCGARFLRDGKENFEQVDIHSSVEPFPAARFVKISLDHVGCPSSLVEEYPDILAVRIPKMEDLIRKNSEKYYSYHTWIIGDIDERRKFVEKLSRRKPRILKVQIIRKTKYYDFFRAFTSYDASLFKLLYEMHIPLFFVRDQRLGKENEHLFVQSPWETDMDAIEWVDKFLHEAQVTHKFESFKRCRVSIREFLENFVTTPDQVYLAERDLKLVNEMVKKNVFGSRKEAVSGSIRFFYRTFEELRSVETIIEKTMRDRGREIKLEDLDIDALFRALKGK